MTVEAGWLTTIGAIIGALIGGFSLWIANRVMGRAAFQTAINSGFNSLLDQLQEERAASQAAVQSLRDELQRERGLRYEEQSRTTAERALLRGEIANLTQRVASLTRQLQRTGIEGLEPTIARPTDLIVVEAYTEDEDNG